MTFHGEEFTNSMNRVMLAVGLIAEEPIEDLINTVLYAQMLSPILEPTAYQRGGYKNLDEQGRILSAVAALVRVYRQIRAENGVPS